MQKTRTLLLLLLLSSGLLMGQLEVGTSTKSNTGALKVVTDIDCELFVDGTKKGTLKAGEENLKKIPLGRGVFLIVAKSLDGKDEKQYNLKMKKKDKELYIELKTLRDSRLAEENLLIEELSNYAEEHDFVLVEGGSFMMGCTSEQSDCGGDEDPIHQVTLSSYYMGKYEVTQAQWESLMGTNPSAFSDCANCPVENVTWVEVQDFIEKLNVQSAKTYRLPTEAEWEYAARGGNKSATNKYAGNNSMTKVGWYSDNCGDKTHAVGQLSANELGLYDMSGNVWEWCSDWHGDYSSASETNPVGPTSGSYRILRGGSWFDYAKSCRVSFRRSREPEARDSHGFRLVLVP